MATSVSCSNNPSLIVSYELNQLGIEPPIIVCRRESCLVLENLQNMLAFLLRKNIRTFSLGGQVEGSIIPGLNSDMDILQIIDEYAVIKDLSSWEEGKTNLLMLQEDTAPGYCRLQLIRPDEPIPFQALPPWPKDWYTFDQQHRVIYKSDWNYCNDTFPERNGPAVCPKRKEGKGNMDLVYAINCKQWPNDAFEWVHRERLHGWPPINLIKKAVEGGCFVVPVGYKLSETKDLEWRISFSLAERDLIFSLTTVHIKCYVVLKMLKETFIKPCVSDSISSYHCKTALLYCVEERDPQFWREDNLIKCIADCLNYLLRWVQDGHCPHYIMPKSNLFASKVISENRKRLISILQSMSKDVWKYLTQVSIDEFGASVQQLDPLQNVFSNSHFHRSTFHIHKNKCECFIFTLHIADNAFMEFLRNLKVNNLIEHIQQSIGNLKTMLEYSDKNKRDAINLWIPHLSTLLASLITSLSLSQHEGIPREALELFENGNKSNIASALKYASALYCSGEKHKCNDILGNIMGNLQTNISFTACNCSPRGHIISDTFCRQFITMSDDEHQRCLFFCVVFSAHEIFCIPKGMQYELQKAVGKDEQDRDGIEKEWVGLAVADCIPYLYYLQYLNCDKLGLRELQKEALNEFKCFLELDTNHGHIETSYNLLGQCYEQENMPEAASNCYRKSLEIRQRNNAAN